MINKHNTDILDCLSNLSSDEIFTPPKIVNYVLDLLPQEIWSDKNVTFLDPCLKTGVFLREIVKRLIKGLENQITDLQERINHILKNQIFGLSLTELTSDISRRTLYCSKKANSKFSITNVFDDEFGNIFYKSFDHVWEKSKCKFCGANQIYERDEELETYAYSFIHDENLFGDLNMRFDVIIGNPPYHFNDGGGSGSSAIPIYNKFVEQAIKMNPRFITMIIPSRWTMGGKGLDSFRKYMLSCNKISNLVDYINSSDCFTDVDVNGGICYFLWERNFEGQCKIKTIDGDKETVSSRYLISGGDSFIRFSEAIPIIEKVNQKKLNSFSELVSYRNPFNIPSNFSNFYKKQNDKLELTKIYAFKNVGLLSLDFDVEKNRDLINKLKIFIPKALGEANIRKRGIFLKPILGEINSVCTETYLCIGPFDSEEEQKNCCNYMKTKFFHFLFGLKRISQNTTKDTYSFVPLMNWKEKWNDEKLYKYFELTNEEIDYIGSFFM